MTNFLYHMHVLSSRLAETRLVKFLFPKKHLHTARWAFLHELAKMAMPKEFLSKKITGILLAVGTFDRLLCLMPTKKQKELTNVIIIGDTRSGKGLNCSSNLLWLPYPTVTQDIKEEYWPLVAGFREQELGGRALKFDPRGFGARYDPLAGLKTDSDFRSAATILLHRPNEGENAIFTERAITQLVQIFTAAWLEGYRLLPFTYLALNEGLPRVAEILQKITKKHGYYPNLATKFLDMTYEQAVRDNFSSRFLNDCYSTMTTRLNNILTKESVRCFMGSDFTAKDIITSAEHPLSIFLCWPEKDLLALSPLIELVWDSLVNGMTAAYDDVRGVGCSRTFLFLDEIFRTGMKKLPDYITTICSRNISIILTAQSISQLFDAYGSFKAKIVLGQMKAAIVHPPSPLDNDGAKFIEEALYYTSGFAHSTSAHEGGSSHGESEQRVPLMPADEIKQLAEDEEKIIGFRKGVRPFIAKRVDWRDFPELARRANMTPPDVPVLPPLPFDEFIPPVQPTREPLASWHFAPDLYQRLPAASTSNGVGKSIASREAL